MLKHKCFKSILFILCLWLISSSALAATITSTASGYWSNGGTWVGGTIPSSTDSVVISLGHTVLFDRNDTSTTCGTIEIKSGGILKLDSTASILRTMQVKGDIKVYGKLELIPGSTLKLECETNGQYGIIVYSGGELKGTGSVPTVLTTLAAPLAIGGQTITVADASGFGVGDIITLGDGANAEGFTISAISGTTTITLNRKALNAQVFGAEVYKNATVAASNISAGSKTFTVANLGGIKAGDEILVAATWQHYYWENQTEIRTVETVDLVSQAITVTSPLTYQHVSGALVAKINRDCKVTANSQKKDRGLYILINDSGKIDLDYVELQYLGQGTEWSSGIEINSDSESLPLKGCALKNSGSWRLIYLAKNNLALVSNIIIPNKLEDWQNNRGDIGIDSTAANNYLISNLVSISGHYGIVAVADYLLNNYVFSNAYLGISLDGPNIVLFNKVFSNSPGVQITYNNNLLYSNELLNNDIGIFSYYTAKNNLLLQNNIKFNNSVGAYVISDKNCENTGLIFVDNNFSNNANQDILIQNGSEVNGQRGKPLNLKFLNCLFSNIEKPISSQDTFPNADIYLISKKHNGQSGTTRIFGNYKAEGLDKFNYIDPTYSSSSTLPILFRGSNHAITTPETSDAFTTTEVWFATYRSATANWEVKGTVSGLQSARASSGVIYTSDNGQVKFTITQAGGVQEGDQFVFATIAAVGDANTQKKIYFEQCSISVPTLESSIVVNSGGKIELKGTVQYPTLIDYDGAGSYGVVISGEVDAQYFDFNQINSDGVKIDPTATITKFDDGNIRNLIGSGAHLSVSGKDHTFNKLTLDNTGAYDVKASSDANLTFVRSQRGKFLDSIADTSSISWDEPILGYTNNYVIGILSYDSASKVLTILFKIKEPNNLNCTFKNGSFQYSQNGGQTWQSVSDSDLSGIGGSFASSTSFVSASEHKIYWNTGANYSNIEANLAVQFRVNNGYVYGDYGTSESIPFNLKPPVVQVLSPNGGELFKGGATAAITWSATDEGSGIANNSVAIYYNAGAGDVLIANNLANTGSYNWAVPTIDSMQIKIKVTAGDNVGESSEDISDNIFEIDSTPPILPSVNPVKTPTVLLSQILSGNRPADAVSVLVNGSSGGATYPTSTTWTYNTTLPKGVNTFRVIARDAAGNDSPAAVATVEVRDSTFTDSDSASSVTVPVGATSEEVNHMNFARLDLPGANPRGTLSLEQAFQITSNVSSFLSPISITLPKPSGASHPRPFIWDSTGNKWLAIPAKSSTGSSLTFDSNQLGIFVVFDLVDFEGPVIGDVKVNGRNMSSGDSIISKPSITLSVTDNYGLDASQMFISMDGSVSKSLAQETGKAMQAGAPITASYAFSNNEELSLGDHIFKIMAADEVGNVATREITLCVVGASIPNLLLYPNPCRAGGAVTFEASEDITVRIYDISGALVWSGQSVPGTWKVIWATVNSSGSSVAPGIYLYVITTNSGGKQSGKIAIIR